MAVHREPYNCLKCGQPYEAIYSEDIEKEPNYSGIIGDNFVRWDLENHKCSTTYQLKIEKLIQEGLKSHLLSVTHCGYATPIIQKTSKEIISSFVDELEDLKREVFNLDIYSFEKVQNLINKLNNIH